MRASVFWLLVMLGVAGAHVAWSAPAVNAGQGTRTFVAHPKVGNAQLNLPSVVRWDSAASDDGRVRVILNADVDLQQTIVDIRKLSAKALDRSIACSTLIRVKTAAAKVIGPTSLKYDLQFHYAKRICAGALPMEFAADVSCSSRIEIAAKGSVVIVDVVGASTPPCRMDGAYQGVSEAVSALIGNDIFKRHIIDVQSLLPAEFKGVVITIRSLVFDVPPARARLHLAGESLMTRAQFDTLVAALAVPAGAVK